MDSMGARYAEGVILDLEETWKESDPRTPLICFLSMGSDPTDSIIALGKKLKVETRYVSMGQGQEVHARKLLQQTMANVSQGCEVNSALASFDVAANQTSLSQSFDFIYFYFLYIKSSLDCFFLFNLLNRFLMMFFLFLSRAAGRYSRTVTWV